MLFELSVSPADVSITSVTSTESVAVEPTPPSARSRPSPAVRTLSFVRVVSSEPFVITTYEAPGATANDQRSEQGPQAAADPGAPFE